jgi:integrative and conjugative element protein (TIGR02256 family)
MIVYPIGQSGQSLVFTKGALAVFAKYRQRHWWQREAGGQLFARFESSQIVVAAATKPGRADLRTRFSFRPNRRREQRDILKYHAQDLHFVGDWHTHPEAVPTISPEDAESVSELVRRSRHDLNGFVLVIVGTEVPPEGLSVSVSDTASLTVLRATRAAELTPRGDGGGLAEMRGIQPAR